MRDMSLLAGSPELGRFTCKLFFIGGKKMSGPNGSDSGDLTSSTLSIEERDGAIVLFIGETYAILPPEQSIAVGELLVQYGYHQNDGKGFSPLAHYQPLFSTYLGV